MLLTARSWWIPFSQEPNLRRWSRTTLPMERSGSRCNVIVFLTPRRPIYWVVSSGYLIGKSSRRNSEDNGARIVCCVESQPLLSDRTCRSSSLRGCLVPISIQAKMSPIEERFDFIAEGKSDIIRKGLLTQNRAVFQLQDTCPPSLRTDIICALILY